MIYTIIILILLFCVAILSKKFLYHKISFKETIELIELPVIVFRQNEHKLNLLLDTGATYSVINEKALSYLEYDITDKYTIMFGVDGVPRKTPVINLSLVLNDTVYVEQFQVADISAAMDDLKRDSGVTIHGIIGNTFMRKYKYVLDFDEMTAYSKKINFKRRSR